MVQQVTDPVAVTLPFPMGGSAISNASCSASSALGRQPITNHELGFLWETPSGMRGPGLALAQIWLCGHLGSE